MTLLGLKRTGLIKVGTPFSVQGNFFAYSSTLNQPTGAGANKIYPLAMLINGATETVVNTPMPYGGKVLHMKIFRKSTVNGNHTFTMTKNSVDQTMSLSFVDVTDDGVSKDTGNTKEFSFNQNDRIGLRITAVAVACGASDYNIGILVAFNVGSATP